MIKISDYKNHLELVMYQWQNSDNLKGIIEAAMEQGNKMEDAIFEVRDLTNLDTAEGINLDILGKPWNQTRDLRSDNDYREAIKQKKLQFYSGEPEAIMAILKASYSGTYVNYTPEYPGKYRVVTDAAITREAIDEISMAGITGFISGFLIDALGNSIVDVQSNNIIHVNE